MEAWAWWHDWRAAGRAVAGCLWRWRRHAVAERAACRSVADECTTAGECNPGAEINQYAVAVTDDTPGSRCHAYHGKYATTNAHTQSGSERYRYGDRHRATGADAPTGSDDGTGSDSDTGSAADRYANQSAAAHAHRPQGDGYRDGCRAERAATNDRAECCPGPRRHPWQHGAANGGADVRRRR